MRGQEVRYCTTEDGVGIAYCVRGEGTPLLACPAFVESFSLVHYLPEEEAFWAKVSEHHQVIRFDWRGTGLSEREIEGYSLEALCRDIDAVAAALRLRKFALWASGSTSPVALTFAATRPNQVSRLVAYGPIARTADAMHPEAVRAYAMLWRTNPAVASQTLADLSHRQQYPTAGEQLGRTYFESIKGEAAAHLLEAAVEPEWDAGPFLSSITAPTLIMHRRGDTLFPAASGQAIAARVKKARFLPLEGEVHYHAFGDSDAVLDAMLAFLAEDDTRKKRASKTAPAGMAVILFTDIANSTALTERMGDAAFREASRALDAGLRAAIGECGGVTVEAKTLGDGVLATFGSAAQAIEGARRCLALSAASELGLHIGAHAGDVIREEGNVFGGAVNIAARICALSAPGEILVSDVVRGMARTSAGVVFEDRGEREMKGVGEPVRVYAVRSD
jgi:class 3 adenylate cyclase/pimeloyl-ACP methyl ester carboxylesterase